MTWAEEQQARSWEALRPDEKDALIAERRRESEVYGTCQKCRFVIRCLGKDWPSRCPRCGHGPEL